MLYRSPAPPTPTSARPRPARTQRGAPLWEVREKKRGTAKKEKTVKTVKRRSGSLALNLALRYLSNLRIFETGQTAWVNLPSASNSLVGVLDTLPAPIVFFSPESPRCLSFRLAIFVSYYFRPQLLNLFFPEEALLEEVSFAFAFCPCHTTNRSRNLPIPFCR